MPLFNNGKAAWNYEAKSGNLPNVTLTISYSAGYGVRYCGKTFLITTYCVLSPRESKLSGTRFVKPERTKRYSSENTATTNKGAKEHEEFF